MPLTQEAKTLATPEGQEIYILCRARARREKGKAIRRRFSAQLESALGRLQERGESGELKSCHKLERRLGQIQARSPQVADLYQIEVVEQHDSLR